MKLGIRWYGSTEDSIPLKYVKQIPNVTEIWGSLYDVPVGEVWPMDKILALRDEVNRYGFNLHVIESVNVHEEIKLGGPDRDKYIENYKETIRNLSKAGVKVVCYNMMTVFDWMKTDMAMPLPDGSNTMAYDQEIVDKMNPADLADYTLNNTNGFLMPGWEPERIAYFQVAMKQYENVTEEDLFQNYKYFLEQVIPVCEECDVKLSVHPDDPPWSFYGLPRVVHNADQVRRILKAVDSPYNGLTMCVGSFAEDPANDVPAMIREFGSQGRIHLVHFRNAKITGYRKFHESAHYSECGSVDMYEVMRAIYDTGHEMYLRPDHGRMIWDEKSRPGYGLYDRALGASYINGLWEAISKENRNK